MDIFIYILNPNKIKVSQAKSKQNMFYKLSPIMQKID